MMEPMRISLVVPVFNVVISCDMLLLYIPPIGVILYADKIETIGQYAVYVVLYDTLCTY